MSQIDQAFIKAYHSKLGATPQRAADATPTTLQRGSLGGRGLRVDAPHVQAEPVAPPSGSQRVPTPHLQLTPEVAARLSGLAGRRSVEQEPTPGVTAQRWTSKFRARNNFHSAPENATALTADESIPESEATNYKSVEETLMRLVGVAETELERDEIQIVSGRIHREVELDRANDSVEPKTAEPAPVEPSVPPASVEVEAADAVEFSEPVVEEVAAVEEAVEPEPAPAVETEVAAPEIDTTTATADVEEAEQPAETPESTAEPEVQLESSKGEALQPAWEVDSFHWPEVVCQLQSDPIAGVEAACISLRATANKMLAVSGVNEGVGATTVSLLLARGLAKLGLKVALVDADFEQPSLAESLGVRVQEGWEAVIDGRLPLEEVCVASLSDGVTFVPLIQNAEASATKASLNAAGVLRQLSDEFDFVLIDAGTGSENVAAVATSSDEVLDVAVLLAVDERHFDSTLTKEIVAHLKQFSIDSIQMVQTFVAV